MSKYRLYRAMYDLEGKHCGNEYMGEVITCKDCKHRDPEDKKCDCGMWHFPYTTDDNDYCSYGERREP